MGEGTGGGEGRRAGLIMPTRNEPRPLETVEDSAHHFLSSAAKMPSSNSQVDEDTQEGHRVAGAKLSKETGKNYEVHNC
jgi:hypothetical protein